MYRFNLDVLYSDRSMLEQKIGNYFPDGKIRNGDNGYQQLIEELEDINRDINDILISNY